MKIYFSVDPEVEGGETPAKSIERHMYMLKTQTYFCRMS